MIGISLLGQGGICKIVMDILRNYSDNFYVENIYDDNELKHNTLYNDVLTIGCIDDYIDKASNNSFYFNCLGNINAFHARIKYSSLLKKKGAKCINIVHPKCYVSKETFIGSGNLIAPNVTVNTNVSIGDENIICSHTVIEHDSIIGNLCYLSPSSTICGKVIIDDQVYIGPGAVLTSGIKIGKNSIVGAGAVVLHDIPANSVYVGNPAKILKNNDLWGEK